MVKTLIFLVIFTLFVFTGFPVEASRHDIQVTINGLRVMFDVTPIIHSERVLLPVRTVSETLGATVDWSGDGEIIITRKTKRISLRLNQSSAFVNGEIVVLDVPAMLISGRTLVPLRFIGEALGAIVNWNQSTRTVAITTLLSRTATKDDQITLPTADTVEIFSTQGQRLSIGMSNETLIGVLGEPNRREFTLYGYDWWIYTNQPGGLLLAGIADNSVAAVYTDSPMWRIAGFAPGDSFDSLSGLHHLRETVLFRHQQADIIFHLESEVLLERPLVFINDKAITFYLDIASNREISAIRIMEPRSFLATGGYSLSWRTVAGRSLDFGIPVLTEVQRQLALSGQERIMFDLVNSFRVRKGQSVLLWHNEIAYVAREHSRDMFVNDFFSHHSASTGSPAERVRRANIENRGVGENLVVGTPDAIDAHHGLLNSPGHRENMLFRRYTHLGVGIVERYYTQKFMIQ